MIENLHHLIVMRADLLHGSFNKFWCYESLRVIVRFEVFLTVGGPTDPGGFKFPPTANITGHIFRSSSVELKLSQLLH